MCDSTKIKNFAKIASKTGDKHVYISDGWIRADACRPEPFFFVSCGRTQGQMRQIPEDYIEMRKDFGNRDSRGRRDRAISSAKSANRERLCFIRQPDIRE